MKKLWRKIRHWFKDLFKKAKAVTSLGLKPVPWNKAVHASCWDGANASRRMMNLLSPHFPDAKFQEYAAWMKARGCDTAHVILVNKADGEGAGYNCATNAAHAALAKARIDSLCRKGFAVVPWIVADDSAAWAKDLFANAPARMKALADAELFALASYVVLGLEMDEYGNMAQWAAVREALRAAGYKGKIGTHHASGNRFPFAGLGDIVLGQLDPKGATDSTIRAQIKAIRALGKEAVGFEYARSPDRNKAQIALAAGAIGVGNW